MTSRINFHDKLSYFQAMGFLRDVDRTGAQNTVNELNRLAGRLARGIEPVDHISSSVESVLDSARRLGQHILCAVEAIEEGLEDAEKVQNGQLPDLMKLIEGQGRKHE